MSIFKRDDWSNQSRFAGLSSWVAPFLAIALCLISVGVVAQTTFEFEDPLEDVRRQIETTEPRAAPANVTDRVAAAGETVSGQVAETARNAEAAADRAVSRTQGAAASLADRFGLSNNGLLSLLGVGLLALGSLIAWLLFRRRKPAPRRPAGTIYAENGPRKRRVLDSGAHVVRRKRAALDTSETADDAKAATVAMAATADRAVHAEVAAEEGPSEQVVADDPDTWRRPNLDRLKASIRDDWKGEDRETAAKTAFESDDAQAFAELFGDEAPEPFNAPQNSAVLDMLDTYEADPEPLPVDALQEAVKAHAPQIETAAMTDRVRSSLPSRAEALRRVRALRDSVKAG